MVQQLFGEVEKQKAEIRRLKGRIDSIVAGEQTFVAIDPLLPDPILGAIIVGNATPLWERLTRPAPSSNERYVLGFDGMQGSPYSPEDTKPNWKFSHHQPGYLAVGVASAPDNTNSGDLTALRLSLGNRVLGGASGAIVDVVGTMDETVSAARSFALFQNTIVPASNSSTEFRALYYLNLIEPGSGITLAGVRSGYFENRTRSNTTIEELIGVFSAPVVIDSGSPATVGTVSTAVGFDTQLYIRPSGTSVISVTSLYGFRSRAMAHAGLTVTTLAHFILADPTDGTFATQIGLDVPFLSRASSNIGIRNASPTVYTPSTVQDVTAAATTLLANATIIILTADNDYTLSSTPTIADGQNGQVLTILNVDSADTITLQDETQNAGSNLRLAGAVNLALGPRDSVTLAFSSSLGDWIEIARSNN
jgi:hypothetical protein